MSNLTTATVDFTTISPTTITVLKALASRKFTQRTLKGIAQDTGLSRKTCKRIIKQNPDFIRFIIITKTRYYFILFMKYGLMSRRRFLYALKTRDKFTLTYDAKTQELSLKNKSFSIATTTNIQSDRSQTIKNSKSSTIGKSYKKDNWTSTGFSSIDDPKDASGYLFIICFINCSASTIHKCLTELFSYGDSIEGFEIVSDNTSSNYAWFNKDNPKKDLKLDLVLHFETHKELVGFKANIDCKEIVERYKQMVI